MHLKLAEWYSEPVQISLVCDSYKDKRIKSMNINKYGTRKIYIYSKPDTMMPSDFGSCMIMLPIKPHYFHWWGGYYLRQRKTIQLIDIFLWRDKIHEIPFHWGSFSQFMALTTKRQTKIQFLWWAHIKEHQWWKIKKKS